MMVLPHQVADAHIEFDAGALRRTAASIGTAVKTGKEGRITFSRQEAHWIRCALTELAERVELDD